MQSKYKYIRMFVTKIDTLDAECSMIFCDKNGLSENDILFTFFKLSIYIDNKSIPYLNQANIDLEVNGLNSKLIIQAPFLKGLSNDLSLIYKVKHFLKNTISPQLLLHGGDIKLMKITKDNYVVVKFSGGCNGCSMVMYTLKNNIERKLLKCIPELNGVLDITNHKTSTGSFY